MKSLKKPTRLVAGKTLIREREIGKAGISTTIVYEYCISTQSGKVKGYLGFVYNGESPDGYIKGSFTGIFLRKTHALEVIDKDGRVKSVL